MDIHLTITDEEISTMADSCMEWVLSQIPEEYKEKIRANKSSAVYVELIGLMAGVLLDRIITAMTLEDLEGAGISSEAFQRAYGEICFEGTKFLSAQISKGLNTEPCVYCASDESDVEGMPMQ